MSETKKTQIPAPARESTRAANAVPPPQALLPAESKAVTLLDPAMRQLAQVIDQTATDFARAIQNASGHMERSFLMADGIVALRKAITAPALASVLALMNSPNGFKTDKPTRGSQEVYPAEVVRECLITALLHGVYPVGNEFNIIAGQCYIAQAGWKRKFEQIGGISDINPVPGTPVNKDGQWCVRVGISWKLDGVFNQLTDHEGKAGRVFPVEVQGQAKVDNLIGKALAKAYRAAFGKATGSVCTLPEGEITDRLATNAPQLPATGTRSEQVLGKLGGAAGAGPATPAQVARINVLLKEVALSEEEYCAVCEGLSMPVYAHMGTEAQAARLITNLEGIAAQARIDAEKEREAIAG